ncbi:MAG: PAS domain S-box protein, partial [Bdellovibrionales bacterium]|nr:PAS domain S-box protein [Bdellovibrionales bacterium]
RQKRHQSTIVKIASNKKVANGNIPEAFQVITRLATEACDVERVSIWLFSEDKLTLECEDLYLRSKRSHRREDGINVKDFPSYFNTVLRDRVIDAHNARFDPRTNEFAESYLNPKNIASMLDAVVRVRGEVVGLVCLEQVGPQRIWTSDEVAFAGELADHVAQTLLNRDRRLARESLEEAYAVLEERVKQRTAELRESELRFRQVVENIREVFWMTDPTKNEMLFLSKAYEEVWGRSRESVYSSPLSFVDSIHEEDRQRVIDAFPKQALGEYDETYRLVRPKGDIRWIRDRAFPVVNEKGKVVRVAGIAEDITEQVEAQHRLEQSELFLSTILNNIPITIFVKDAKDLSFVLVNKAEEALTGYKLEEKLGKTDLDFFPKEQAEFFRQKDRQVLLGGDHVDIPEEPIDTKYMGRRILHTQKIPLYDSKGTPKYLLGISQDITQQKQHELSMRRAERLASIGTLAAGIAHEINNPLGLIQLEADSLLRSLDSASQDQTKAINKIREHVNRCSNIVRNILLFSREQASEKKPCSIESIIENAVRLTQRHAQQHLISFTKEIPEEDIIVFGNSVELEQVMVNLLHNAIHASNSSHNVKIQACVDGKSALISVIDSGYGMSEEQLQQALDPFFTTRQSEGGTGLGLSICHGIVTDHNGRLDIQSELGSGTTVSIRIPVYQAH